MKNRELVILLRKQGKKPREIAELTGLHIKTVLDYTACVYSPSNIQDHVKRSNYPLELLEAWDEARLAVLNGRPTASIPEPSEKWLDITGVRSMEAIMKDWDQTCARLLKYGGAAHGRDQHQDAEEL